MTRISNGQMTSWSTREGLAANHVKAFYQDADGTMWIGTHGGGLSRFKDGRFATISARTSSATAEPPELLLHWCWDWCWSGPGLVLDC